MTGAMITMDPVVTTEWLATHLGEPDLRVVDGSWHMPQAQRDAAREFHDAHLPGAVFFDIDRIADTTSGLPHMLPSPQVFARAVGALGIGDGDRGIVYSARLRTRCGGGARRWAAEVARRGTPHRERSGAAISAAVHAALSSGARA